MIPAFIAICIVAAERPASEPPSLSKQQLTRIQQLIRSTKKTDVSIKEQLAKRQKELMRAYRDFELDEDRVGQLHAEILDLQRQLLSNYHELQVELRDTVGEQRFKRLKLRIDRYLKDKEKPSPRKSTSERTREAK